MMVKKRDASESAAASSKHPAAAASHASLVVGIGASAGGVTARRAFFDRIRPDDGFACVIVQHLPPQHESNLAAVSQSHSAIPAIQATEMVDIEPDHA